MDFEISEKMTTILGMVRSFVDSELVPIENEMLHGDPDVVDKMVADAQAKVRQMELWAPNHPVVVINSNPGRRFCDTIPQPWRMTLTRSYRFAQHTFFERIRRFRHGFRCRSGIGGSG